MNLSRLSKIVFFIAALTLLFSAGALSRDYQDGWILESLEVPFVFFVIAYSWAFFSEKRTTSMVALAVIAQCVFLLIPNLKYVWFQGTAIDQHIQYSLANYVYGSGDIARSGHYNVLIYGTTPFIHLILNTFSIILAAPVVYSMKFVPILLSPIYPLATYCIVKNMEFFKRSNITKYALFISSVPFSSERYIVTGSQFGGLLAFLIFTVIVMLLKKSDRRYWSVFAILVVVLAATHSSSSLLLVTFIISVALVHKQWSFRPALRLNTTLVFFVSTVSLAWLMFPALFTLRDFLGLFSTNLLTGTTPASESVPNRFFEVLSADVLGALRTLLVFNGAQVFLIILTFIALLILLKTWKQLDNVTRFSLSIPLVMFLLLPFALLLKLGTFRIVNFVSPFFPIYAAVTILYIIKNRRLALAIRSVAFILIVFFATIQLYSCQPLVPSASVLSSALPSNEPIVYVNSVNSIYNRQMIVFTENHVRGLIACDRVTQNQIVGLTDFNFSAMRLTYYYPIDKKQVERSFDIFLIHLPGPSGRFEEQAELRTMDLITGIISSSSIFYTNGESFVLGDFRYKP